MTRTRDAGETEEPAGDQAALVRTWPGFPGSATLRTRGRTIGDGDIHPGPRSSSVAACHVFGEHDAATSMTHAGRSFVPSRHTSVTVTCQGM